MSHREFIVKIIHNSVTCPYICTILIKVYLVEKVVI